MADNNIQNKTLKERDLSLDLMRLLGVLIIMLAHSEPPYWLHQLRNFGTPLLIVASGLTYSVVYTHKELMPLSFIKKRLSRLIIPTWIFLCVFFIIFYFFFHFTSQPYPFTIIKILSSFALYQGIGYVWIFKVYIILAILTPLALSFKKNIQSNFLYFFYIILCYLFYEIFVVTVSPSIPSYLLDFMNKIVFIIIPYSLLYLYGLKLGQLVNKSIAFISLVFFIIFIGLAIYYKEKFGIFLPTHRYKYPPSLYYLSYAIFALNLIFIGCRLLVNKINKGVVVWLSSNSLWIYLWHIFAIYLWRYSIGSTNNELGLSIVKAIFLLGFGVSMTYLQSLFINNLLRKTENSTKIKLLNFLK